MDWKPAMGTLQEVQSCRRGADVFFFPDFLALETPKNSIQLHSTPPNVMYSYIRLYSIYISMYVCMYIYI